MVAKNEEGLGVKKQIPHNIDFNQISLKNKYVGYRWLLAINMQNTGSYTLKIITCDNIRQGPISSHCARGTTQIPFR